MSDYDAAKEKSRNLNRCMKFAFRESKRSGERIVVWQIGTQFAWTYEKDDHGYGDCAKHHATIDNGIIVEERGYPTWG